jgi:hypothetical protein
LSADPLFESLALVPRASSLLRLAGGPPTRGRASIHQGHLKLWCRVAVTAIFLAQGLSGFKAEAAPMAEIKLIRNKCPAMQDILDDISRDFERSLQQDRQDLDPSILERIRQTDLETIKLLLRCFNSEIEYRNISASERESGTSRVFAADIPVAKLRGPANPQKTEFVEIEPALRLVVREKVDGSIEVLGKYIAQ